MLKMLKDLFKRNRKSNVTYQGALDKILELHPHLKSINIVEVDADELLLSGGAGACYVHYDLGDLEDNELVSKYTHLAPVILVPDRVGLLREATKTYLPFALEQLKKGGVNTDNDEEFKAFLISHEMGHALDFYGLDKETFVEKRKAVAAEMRRQLSVDMILFPDPAKIEKIRMASRPEVFADNFAFEIIKNMKKELVLN